MPEPTSTTPDPQSNSRPPRLAIRDRGIFTSREQKTPRFSRDGVLHEKNSHGQYVAPSLPGPNDSCACGSGRKAKKCCQNPALAGRAIVNRVNPDGACDACGRTGVDVIPLHHTGIPDWTRHVCADECALDPSGTLRKLLGKPAVAQPAPWSATNLRPVMGTLTERVPLQNLPDVVAGSGKALSWSLSNHADPERIDGRHFINIRCDQDHVGRLGPRHEVSPDGVVMPSIGCNEDGCGWHAWGRLNDWTVQA